jgi:hypothetical protein
MHLLRLPHPGHLPLIIVAGPKVLLSLILRLKLPLHSNVSLCLGTHIHGEVFRCTEAGLMDR